MLAVASRVGVSTGATDMPVFAGPAELALSHESVVFVAYLPPVVMGGLSHGCRPGQLPWPHWASTGGVFKVWQVEHQFSPLMAKPVKQRE